MPATFEQIETAIRSPKFSHARAGDRLYRGSVLIYHFAEKSPSGVLLECVGDEAIVDPLLREIQRTSPLSPTER